VVGSPDGAAVGPAHNRKGDTSMPITARNLLLGAALLALPAGAVAEGNLATQTIRLDPTVMKADLSFAPLEYQIETGKYYRWEIVSEGGEEFQIMAPELFRNIWVNQIVINDIEVKPFGGAVYSIEFDSEGSAAVWFVPIRPGEYEYYVDGYEERGMLGKFVVR
jgi:uncharacterized cupredoxin-like copper-binding protein